MPSTYQAVLFILGFLIHTLSHTFLTVHLIISYFDVFLVSIGDASSSMVVGGVQEEPIPTLSWPPETFDQTSGDEDSLMGLTNNSGSKSGGSGMVAVCDPTERRTNALAALKAMCESAVLAPHLPHLLSTKDGQGQTPFMLAVSSRAYRAALALLDAASRCATSEQRASAIFPRNSPADASPLLVLCCNDTCSFTWTGQEHINQDIFECRTCGLTGSLCCCTECAKVCHLS